MGFPARPVRLAAIASHSHAWIADCPICENLCDLCIPNLFPNRHEKWVHRFHRSTQIRGITPRVASSPHPQVNTSLGDGQDCPSYGGTPLYFPVRSSSRVELDEEGQAVVPRTRSAGQADLDGAGAIAPTGDVCLIVGRAHLPVPVVHDPPERVHLGSRSALFRLPASDTRTSLGDGQDCPSY